MTDRDCTHLPRELRDLAGDLRYCDAESLAATLMYAAADEIEKLRDRQEKHLALIANIANATPFPDEVEGWVGQRAAMIAEVGSLRSEVREIDTALRSLVRAHCFTPLLIGHSVAVDQEQLSEHLLSSSLRLRPEIATTEELRTALDFRLKLLTVANEYVRERARTAEAVRDDARAASQRDLEARRRAWEDGVRACVEAVERRHQHYELYRCDCLARVEPSSNGIVGHLPGCKAEMMSTHPATFAVLEEIHVFLSALLLRGERP